jgi:hypothetical protein
LFSVFARKLVMFDNGVKKAQELRNLAAGVLEIEQLFH